MRAQAFDPNRKGMPRHREAILGEEVRTSLKTDLGLYFCSAFIAPIVGHYITDLVRLAIDITVRIFNY